MKGLTKKYLDDLTYEIIGSCIEVHKELGPGLLESIYHKCLKKELTARGIAFVSELSIPVFYKGETIEADLKCDLFIENAIVLELKAVDRMLSLYEAQLLTYMNYWKLQKAFLLTLM